MLIGDRERSSRAGRRWISRMRLQERASVTGREVVRRLPRRVRDPLLRIRRSARTARLTRRFGRRRRRLEDAVFFYVDMGLRAADSALALHDEIRRRGLGLTLYWGVVSADVAVPPGGIAVIKGSNDWYAKVNASRYVVNNYGGILGLRKHPEQRVLQTWHGTPYKFVGRSELRHRGASADKIAAISREAAEWDAFISPSPYMSALIRTEWDFKGTVLETGYPRNDRLVLADRAARQALRADFDLPTDARIVLYAPTFREHQRQGWCADLFDGLDVDELCARLGPGWYVLVRGHSFTARKGSTRRGGDRIRDVTGHPDVNDLYLIADVLVTDYSSSMFDFAVTGKPIVYFTPDMARYSAERGVYFDLAECAPGPLYTDVEALAEGLRGLPALAERYRDRYAAFRGRFAPWDDGHAAARVVDAFFDTRDGRPGG
jgi:CDP-glycerol glycerophosphotransferase